jgi:hypothetical protein
VCRNANNIISVNNSTYDSGPSLISSCVAKYWPGEIMTTRGAWVDCVKISTRTDSDRTWRTRKQKIRVKVNTAEYHGPLVSTQRRVSNDHWFSLSLYRHMRTYKRRRLRRVSRRVVIHTTRIWITSTGPKLLKIGYFVRKLIFVGVQVCAWKLSNFQVGWSFCSLKLTKIASAGFFAHRS